MYRRWLEFILITLFILILAACSGSGTPTETQPSAAEGNTADSQEEVITEEEIEEIDAMAIYTARCARCHGDDRTGKNGPALLPERLTQDAAIYQATIRDGSGPMPAFSNRLSPDEISAMVEFILSDPQ